MNPTHRCTRTTRATSTSGQTKTLTAPSNNREIFRGTGAIIAAPDAETPGGDYRWEGRGKGVFSSPGLSAGFTG